MMKKIMRPIAIFSSSSALNRLTFCVCQSSARYGIAELLLDRLADLRRVVRIVDTHGDPRHRVTEAGELLRDLPFHDDELVVVLKHARLEEPVTSNFQNRGTATPMAAFILAWVTGTRVTMSPG